MLTLAWPSQSWTRAMSASCSRALVAAVARSAWTIRSMGMAAAEAYFRTSL